MTYQQLAPNGLHRQIMRDVQSRLADQNFGEWLIIRPTIRPDVNQAQKPDSSRPVIHIVGIFRAPTTPADTVGGSKQRFSTGETNAPGVMINKPHFSIATDALPYRIARGDIIERCATGQTYEAHAPQLDALHIRALIPVTQLGVAFGAGITSDL